MGSAVYAQFSRTAQSAVRFREASPGSYRNSWFALATIGQAPDCFSRSPTPREIADRNRRSVRGREGGFLWLRGYSFGLLQRQIGFTQAAQKLNFRARDTRLYRPERKRQDIGDFFIGHIFHVIEHKRRTKTFGHLAHNAKQRSRIGALRAVRAHIRQSLRPIVD